MELVNRTWNPPDYISAKEAGRIVENFLDVATTSFGRATHYNTREEQQEAELRAHESMIIMCRDLYAALLTLPGVLDRAAQLGVKKLLSTHRNGVPGQFLTPSDEQNVLYYVARQLPAQRLLKLIDVLRVGDSGLGLKKANNARTRKLIKRIILQSPKLPLWSVKYRSKMRRALVHAWGRRRASIIRSILEKEMSQWTWKEKGIIKQSVYKYADKTFFFTACECIRFVFGSQENLELPVLRSFVDAKRDLKKGRRLPPEVLEGIRSVYHRSVPKEEVIKLTKGSMTSTQKLQVQKRAKAAKVDVQIDPLDYDAVRLYLYAFECGLTKEIEEALDKKAEKAAESFPVKYKRIGIVVDMSKSMEGGETQPLRPAAVALATRDMLVSTSSHGFIEYVGGRIENEIGSLARPAGDTGLADALVNAMEKEPDAVFIISDGYENAPAGLTNDVLAHMRDVGIDTPVYHLNPVMAAESRGVRQISPHAKTLPLSGPGALGTTIVRGMIGADPIRGINHLIRMALGQGQLQILNGETNDHQAT